MRRPLPWVGLGLLLSLLLGLLGLALLRPGSAHAASVITITTCDTTTFLRTLGSAPDGSTILFECSGDIAIDLGISIGGTLTLDGNGNNVTLFGPSQPVFSVRPPFGNLTLKGLTIDNNAFGLPSDLENCGGTVTIVNSTFTGESISVGGGGLSNDCGGTVTITNSTFSDNAGGGLTNQPGSTVTITNSTFSGNFGRDFGGLSNRGFMTITNSTVSHNGAAGAGGGLSNQGTVTITNSTFSGNGVTNSGGGLSNRGFMTITNSTVSGNVAAGEGGGLSGSVTITNSIVAGNSSLTNSVFGNCSFGVLAGDGGNNLTDSGDNSCGFLLSSDVVTALPGLASALANNGGPTATLALLPGSPAINAANPDPAVCPATDQRGAPRPQGVSCDIGAFELVTAVTMETLVLHLRAIGEILPGLADALLALLKQVADAQAEGDCALANRFLQAFIELVRPLTPTPGTLLIANAQYLVNHCP